MEGVETVAPGVWYDTLRSRTYVRLTLQEWKVGVNDLFLGRDIGTKTLAV